MAPKKASGAPLTAGEEPLTAVLLADSFTQVSLKGAHGLIQDTFVAMRRVLRICWLYFRASHEGHQEWHCPGWSKLLCMNSAPTECVITMCWHEHASLSDAINAALPAHVTGEA